MTDRAGIYLLFALAAAMALTISAAIMAPAIGLAGNDSAPSANLNPRDFSTNIDNPLFPLSTLGPKTFEGQDTDRIQAKSSPHDSNRPCWARLARSQVSRYWCSKRRFLRTTS